MTLIPILRNIGPNQSELPQMLQTLGLNSLEELIDAKLWTVEHLEQYGRASLIRLRKR